MVTPAAKNGHQHRPDPKHGEQDGERYERRRDEPQRRRSQDVEHHQRYRDRQRPQMMPGACPGRQRDSAGFRPLPHAARYQDDRAEPERYGNPGREHRCPVFLTRYGWKGSGIKPDHQGEDQQDGPQDRVIDAHCRYRPLLPGDPDRLHHLAQAVVALGHEVAELFARRIDHPEAALVHEVLELGAVINLLQR